MTTQAADQISFHSERAMAELDQALRASSVMAARAHFDLSALHLQRMQSLATDQMPALAQPG